MIVVVALYATWIGFLAVHECGHMLGALLTGDHIISVSIPPFGFSQTIVHPNPHELFVVWSGPFFGAAFPLSLLIFVRLFHRRPPDFLKFFAGLCAIANGAHIGFGWIRRAGDAGDMMRLGTPLSAMLAFGAICLILGFICWHRTAALSMKYWRD